MASVVFQSSISHVLHNTRNTSSETTFSISPCTKTKFAFARIKGEVFLVQGTSSTVKIESSCTDQLVVTVALADCETTPSALTPVDVNIFKHEFITIFRWSHQTTVHPDDIRILEPIDEACIRYEEENGTVFMAKDVVERLRRVMSSRRGPPLQRQRPSLYSRRWC